MAPVDRTTITVKAKFNDDSTRDVTHLAAFDLSVVGVAEMAPSGTLTRTDDGELVVAVRYLGLQVPVRAAFIPNRPVPDASLLETSPHTIDALVAKHLKNLRLKPSELCTDEVFLRRAYLDCCGVLPTPDAVKKFLADTSKDKREKVIDQLLSRQEYADFWTMKWSDLLRNEEKSLDRKGVQIYHRWIKAWVAEDKPLNDFAKEILSARGSTYANPPANFYRAIRDPYQRAESVARSSSASASAAPVATITPSTAGRRTTITASPRSSREWTTAWLENGKKDNLDKHEFVGDQVVYTARKGEVTLPRTNAPAKPKTLGDDIEVNAESDRSANWPSGWRTRRTRSLHGRRPIASGSTSWGVASSSRTTTPGCEPAEPSGVAGLPHEGFRREWLPHEAADQAHHDEPRLSAVEFAECGERA